MLRLGVSTGILYHLPLRMSFALAQELGLDSVEVVLGPETAIRGPAYVRALSQGYDLPVSSATSNTSSPTTTPERGPSTAWYVTSL